MHFRSAKDPNGFNPELLPLHVMDGVGWLPGLLRKEPMPFDASGFASGVGQGGSSYSDYDQRICQAAKTWIDEAAKNADKPWILFVSFVSPHYPLNPPSSFGERYLLEDVELPYNYDDASRPTHPAVRHILDHSGYDRHFKSETEVRAARAAYYGLCTFIDCLVGELVERISATNQADRTQVIFTSDHGEMLGNHGAWTKMLMYEESAGIPLIVSGPDVPRGNVCETPVSLVDVAPTVLSASSSSSAVSREHASDLPGSSLTTIASKSYDRDRTVFSEYHDGWSISGCFMVRWGQWKYVHYEGFNAQLFDVTADPQERCDLSDSVGHQNILIEGSRRLRAIVDPAKADEAAFAAQAQLIEQHGGEAALRRLHEQYFDFTPISEEAGGTARD